MPSVCVFCGSSTPINPVFMDAARETGRRIAELGWTLVYGGARRGLMGAIADAALGAGGRVVGIIPRSLSAREIEHRGLTELLEVDSLQERKALMAERSDAFLTLPGGFGTLDELFEVLTWAMLGMHDKPCVVVDTAGYYTHLFAFVDHALAEGFVPASFGRHFFTAPDPPKALRCIERQLATRNCP